MRETKHITDGQRKFLEWTMRNIPHINTQRNKQFISNWPTQVDKSLATGVYISAGFRCLTFNNLLEQFKNDYLMDSKI